MNDCNASIMHEHDATASLKGSFGKRTRIIVSLNGVQQNFDALGGCACSFKVVAALHIASYLISSIMLPPSNFATFSYIRWSGIPYLSPGSERLCHATAAAWRLPVRQRTVVTLPVAGVAPPRSAWSATSTCAGPGKDALVSFEASFYSVPDRLVRPGQRVRLAVHQGTMTICALGTDADGWPPTTAPLEFHRLAW